MDMKEQIKQFLSVDKYRPVNAWDVHVSDVVEHIERMQNTATCGLELNPTFQRGHVWTVEQQIAFIESLLTNRLGEQGRTITFNKTCVFNSSNTDNIDEEIFGKYLCMDGLQRLTAIMDFINGKFTVFHNNPLNQEFTYEFLLKNNIINSSIYCLRFQFFALPTYQSVLEYYLDFNNGGTVHSKEEIQRVQKLLQAQSKL